MAISYDPNVSLTTALSGIVSGLQQGLGMFANMYQFQRQQELEKQRLELERERASAYKKMVDAQAKLWESQEKARQIQNQFLAEQLQNQIAAQKAQVATSLWNLLRGQTLFPYEIAGLQWGLGQAALESGVTMGSLADVLGQEIDITPFINYAYGNIPGAVEQFGYNIPKTGAIPEEETPAPPPEVSGPIPVPKTETVTERRFVVKPTPKPGALKVNERFLRGVKNKVKQSFPSLYDEKLIEDIVLGIAEGHKEGEWKDFVDEVDEWIDDYLSIYKARQEKYEKAKKEKMDRAEMAFNFSRGYLNDAVKLAKAKAGYADIALSNLTAEQLQTYNAQYLAELNVAIKRAKSDIDDPIVRQKVIKALEEERKAALGGEFGYAVSDDTFKAVRETIAKYYDLSDPRNPKLTNPDALLQELRDKFGLDFPNIGALNEAVKRMSLFYGSPPSSTKKKTIPESQKSSAKTTKPKSRKPQYPEGIKEEDVKKLAEEMDKLERSGKFRQMLETGWEYIKKLKFWK